MLPTIAQCAQYTERDRELLESFDTSLREALVQTRYAKGGDQISNAMVTVILSVAADSALLVEGDPKPTIDEFVAAARDAFSWSRRKTIKAQN